MSQSRRTRRARATALLGVRRAGRRRRARRPRARPRRPRPATARRRSSRASRSTTTPTSTPSSARTRPATVTLIANWIPFEEPAGGPNFYPFATDARYNINIDNDGDAKPDVDLPVDVPATPSPQGLRQLHRQRHLPLQQRPGHLAQRREPAVPADLRPDPHRGRQGPVQDPLVLDNGPVAPSDVGDAVDAGLRDAARRSRHDRTGGSRKSFAGQADDPFFLDLRVFDLLYGGRLLTEVGHDTPRRLQRQHDRAPGADERPDRQGPGRRRHLEHDRAEERVGRLHAGLAARSAAGQRGRHPLQGQGHVQRAPRRRRTPQRCRTCTNPELAATLIERSAGSTPRPSNRDDLVHGVPHGCPRAQPAQAQRAPRAR